MAWPVAVAALSTVPVWAWAWLQTLPATTFAWLEPHPFWAQAALGGVPGMVPMVGLDAAGGRDALMRLASYAAVFWVAYALAQDRARAGVLLKVILGATVACAAYGLAVYFTGAELIGWVPKTAYLGDVTGTFVNRNSFATYVNLGLVICLGMLAEPFLAARDTGDLKRIAAEAVTKVLDERSLLLLGLCVLAMAALQSHSRGGLLSAGLTVVVMVFVMFLVTRPRLPVVLVVVAATLLAGWGLLAASGGITLERLGQVDANYDVEAGRAADLLADLAGDGGRAAVAGARLRQFRGGVRAASRRAVRRAGGFRAQHLYRAPGRARRAGDALLYLGPVLLFGYCVRGVFARRRDQLFPLVAVGATVLVGLHGLVDFSLQIPAVAVTYAAVLGIGVAQAMPSPKRPPRPGASLRE